jgi:hypothetical protein
MHEVISTSISPATALSVGLKVDSEALPAAVVAGIQNGSVNLTLPATTATLLKLNAAAGALRLRRVTAGRKEKAPAWGPF